MRSDTPLLVIATEQIGLAVVALMGWTEVHISERIPTKWKLRKASTRLRALETLVRRLIMLMALQLDLDQAEARLTPTKTENNPTSDAPEIINGVELVDFPTVRQRNLSLLPQLINFSEGVDLSDYPRPSTPTHIMARRFSRRIIALQKVLDAPEAYAKRLARTISKFRKAGEPAPLLMSAPLPSGLSPEIGLLYGGVTMELQDCLHKWDTS
ncbi:MAG: hypothetical protein AAF292_01710 [Pseudomonadota bacterium]